MKKKRILIGLGAFALAGLALSSCGGEKSFTVTFYDGTTELSSQTITNGYNVEVPTDPTSDGKIFNGWYSDEALTNPFDFGSIISGNISVYAAWVNECTVTFKDVSKILSTVKVTPGYNVKEPTAPTKEGQVFLGWYSDAALTKPFDFGSVINSNTTIYAKFDADYVSVNLYLTVDQKYDTIKVEKGSTLPTDLTPEIPYREFDGNWYTDSACTQLYDTSEAIDSELTLYAGWDVSYVPVEFAFDFTGIQNKCGGQGVTSTTELSDGKFTVEAGQRVDNGPLLNTQGKMIYFTTGGNGELKFTCSSKSSGNPLKLSIYKLPLGTDVYKFDYSSVDKPAYYKEVANGETLDDTFDVEAGYIYVMDTEKSAGYSALSLTEQLEESAPADLEVTVSKTNFFAGTELDLGLTVLETFENGAKLQIKDYEVDYSKVVKTKAGKYPVTISYTATDDYDSYDLSAEVEVTIYDLDSVGLSYNAVEKLGSTTSAGNSVYFNKTVQTVYGTTAKELDTDALTVTAYAAEEAYSEIIDLSSDAISITGYDFTKTGKQTVTVTLTLNGVEETATYDLYVVDTEPVITNYEMQLFVDSSFEGVPGTVIDIAGAKANEFKTIQQALDYISIQDNVDAVKKQITLAPGTYKEKLEITIPNLTIKGASEASDRDDYVIEWDSVYGQKDESGFTHTTDSTQTVAVRQAAVNCTISGVTIRNYYNSIDSYEKVYPNNGERALALLVQADKFVMENGALNGWQDTLQTFTGRQYFKNCLISGCVDYIFGTNSSTYFDECKIHTVKSKSSSQDGKAAAYVTAYKGNNKGDNDYVDYGAIFNECNFTVDDDFVGYVCIGRSWAPYSSVYVMNSVFAEQFASTANTLIHNGLGIKNETTTLKYWFYDNQIYKTAEGQTTAELVALENDSFEDIKGSDETTIRHILTAAEAAEITTDKVFATTNGKVTYADYWNPTAAQGVIQVQDDNDETIWNYSTNVFVGKTLTAAQINDLKNLVKAKLDPDTQILDNLYTDASYETKLTTTTNLTDSLVVYAKIKNATVGYVNVDAYAGVSTGETATWKLSDADLNPIENAPSVTYISSTAGTDVKSSETTGYVKSDQIGEKQYLVSPNFADNTYEVSMVIYGGTHTSGGAQKFAIYGYDSKGTVVATTYIYSPASKKSGYYRTDSSADSKEEEVIKVTSSTPIAYVALYNTGLKSGDGANAGKGYGISSITATCKTIEFEEEAGTKVDEYSMNLTTPAATYATSTGKKYLAVDTALPGNDWLTVQGKLGQKSDGATENDLASTAFYVAKEGTIDSLELDKSSNLNSVSYNPGALKFTTKGKATITIEFTTNGGNPGAYNAVALAVGTYTIVEKAPVYSYLTAKTATNCTNASGVYNYDTTMEKKDNAVLTYEIADAGTYYILNPGARAVRIKAISMTDTYTVEAPKTAEDSYSVTFGSTGNYTTANANVDLSGATISNHASEPTSKVVGNISLNVKAGGVVVVYGYPVYYDYSIKVGSAEAVTATAECSYAKVAEDSTVVIASTNYLYEIDVVYPLDDAAEFTYAAKSLATGDGLAFQFVAKKTVNDNGDSYQFKNAGYTQVVFTVAKAGTVVVTGHSKSYGLLTIYKNGTAQELTISDNGTYTLTVAAGDVIAVSGKADDLSHSYIKGVTFTPAA